MGTTEETLTPREFLLYVLVKYSPRKGAQIHRSPSVPSVSFKVLLALSVICFSVILEVWLIYLLSAISEMGNMEDKIFSQTSKQRATCLPVHPYIEEQIFNDSMCFCLRYLLF